MTRLAKTDRDGIVPEDLPQRRLSLGNRELSRRQILAGAGGVAAAAALAACAGDGGTSTSPGGTSAGPPKRGGNFRLGATGGGAQDMFDGQNGLTIPDFARQYSAFEQLTSVDQDNQLAFEGLAESMDIDSPTQYTFRLRQGVEFHNGKTLTADDVMYSLQRLGSNKGLPGNPSTATMDLAGMKKLDKYTVRLPLKTADATVPLSLATFYLGIVPEGYEPFSGDVSTQVGTGPYRLKSFTPGQESVSERHPNYWREGQPYFDTVTITDFKDVTAQVNALLGGQIDAMTELPAAQVASVESRGSKVLESQTGTWRALVMQIDQPPFDDPRVRKAFRLIVDRQSMIDQAFSGRAVLGNDLYGIYDPAYAKDLPQRAQDIAQAKELLAAAGQENLTIDLHTTASTAGMVAIANVFAEHAKEAGVTVNVKNVPSDQYWSDSYMKVPFYATYWAPRPSYLVQAHETDIPGAAYPETHWPPKSGPGSDFEGLYHQALATTDDAERVQIVGQMQELQYEYGGYIIPAFPSVLDAHASNVQGFDPAAKTFFNLNNFGHGFRTIWFA